MQTDHVSVTYASVVRSGKDHSMSTQPMKILEPQEGTSQKEAWRRWRLERDQSYEICETCHNTDKVPPSSKESKWKPSQAWKNLEQGVEKADARKKKGKREQKLAEDNRKAVDLRVRGKASGQGTNKRQIRSTKELRTTRERKRRSQTESSQGASRLINIDQAMKVGQSDHGISRLINWHRIDPAKLNTTRKFTIEKPNLGHTCIKKPGKCSTPILGKDYNSWQTNKLEIGGPRNLLPVSKPPPATMGSVNDRGQQHQSTDQQNPPLITIPPHVPILPLAFATNDVPRSNPHPKFSASITPEMRARLLHQANSIVHTLPMYQHVAHGYVLAAPLAVTLPPQLIDGTMVHETFVFNGTEIDANPRTSPDVASRRTCSVVVSFEDTEHGGLIGVEPYQMATAPARNLRAIVPIVEAENRDRGDVKGYHYAPGERILPESAITDLPTRNAFITSPADWRDFIETRKRFLAPPPKIRFCYNDSRLTAAYIAQSNREGIAQEAKREIEACNDNLWVPEMHLAGERAKKINRHERATAYVLQDDVPGMQYRVVQRMIIQPKILEAVTSIMSEEEERAYKVLAVTSVERFGANSLLTIAETKVASDRVLFVDSLNRKGMELLSEGNKAGRGLYHFSNQDHQSGIRFLMKGKGYVGVVFGPHIPDQLDATPLAHFPGNPQFHINPKRRFGSIVLEVDSLDPYIANNQELLEKLVKHLPHDTRVADRQMTGEKSFPSSSPPSPSYPYASKEASAVMSATEVVAQETAEDKGEEAVGGEPCPESPGEIYWDQTTRFELKAFEDYADPVIQKEIGDLPSRLGTEEGNKKIKITSRPTFAKSALLVCQEPISEFALSPAVFEPSREPVGPRRSRERPTKALRELVSGYADASVDNPNLRSMSEQMDAMEVDLSTTARCARSDPGHGEHQQSPANSPNDMRLSPNDAGLQVMSITAGPVRPTLPRSLSGFPFPKVPEVVVPFGQGEKSTTLGRLILKDLLSGRNENEAVENETQQGPETNDYQSSFERELEYSPEPSISLAVDSEPDDEHPGNVSQMPTIPSLCTGNADRAEHGADQDEPNHVPSVIPATHQNVTPDSLPGLLSISDSSSPYSSLSSDQDIPIYDDNLSLYQMCQLAKRHQGRVIFRAARNPFTIHCSAYIQARTSLPDEEGYHDSLSVTWVDVTEPTTPYVLPRIGEIAVMNPTHPLVQQSETGEPPARRVGQLWVYQKLADWPPNMDDYHVRRGGVEKLDLCIMGIEDEIRSVARGLLRAKLAMDEFKLDKGDIRFKAEDNREKLVAEALAEKKKFEDRVDVAPIPWDHGWPTDERPTLASPKVELEPTYRTHTVVPNLDILRIIEENRVVQQLGMSNGGETAVYMDTVYSEDEAIRDNRVEKVIPSLRSIRYLLLDIIPRIDKLTNITILHVIVDQLPLTHPLQHFYNSHSHISRHVRKATDADDLQGFKLVCDHPIDWHTPGGFERAFLAPVNPLLLKEEDMLLFFASQLIDMAGYVELSNAIQAVRGTTLNFAKDIRNILEKGFLEPITYFDQYGLHQVFPHGEGY